VLVRLENLKLAFDKKSDIFRQELNIYDMRKNQMIKNSIQASSTMHYSFENLESYVKGFQQVKKKKEDFLSPESSKYAKSLPRPINRSNSPDHYGFDEYGRKDFNQKRNLTKGREGQISRTMNESLQEDKEFTHNFNLMKASDNVLNLTTEQTQNGDLLKSSWDIAT
jgi:hypothetical protein